MTDVRELLRAATTDVEATINDPVATVARVVVRRRRSFVGVIAAVVAVVAAIAIPIGLTNGSRSTSSSHHPSPASLVTWGGPDGDVVASDGSLWALKCCSVQSGHSWVDQIDPATGNRIKRITVATPSLQIAAGAGRIWVLGFNPGGGSSSEMTIIDPGSGARLSIQLGGPLSEPHGIAFAAGSAWITQPLLNRVLRVTPPPPQTNGPFRGPVYSRVQVSGAPETIATSGDGTIWVQRAQRTSQILIAADHSRIANPAYAHRPVYGPAGHQTLLAGVGPHEVGDFHVVRASSFDCTTGAVECLTSRYRLEARGHVSAAVKTSRGVFVATSRRTYFFDRASLTTGTHQASATVGVGGTSLAVDGDGVVIGGDRGLIHWVPAG